MISVFLRNVLLVLEPLSALALMGWGPVLLLSDSPAKGFLSPLVGMILFASVGLYRIAVLLVPLSPLKTGATVVLVSALLGLWGFLWGRRLKGDGSWRLLVPLLFCFATAAAFAPSGFHLLNGGEDELQYATDAEQMLHYQHQGGPEDTLFPRADHYVHDFVARDLPYNQGYRRGAEILLAGVARMTGLTTEEAYPITSTLGVLVLLLAAVWLGEALLGLRSWQTLLLQATLASCSYLLVLHFQGSLANLCSVSLLLCGAGTFGLALSVSDRRCAALAGILCAGPVIFYSEVSLAGFALPLSGVFLAAFARSVLAREKRSWLLVSQLLVILAVCLAVSHQGIQSAILSTLANLRKVSAPVHTQWKLTSEMARYLAVVIGIFSYYDLSTLAQRAASFANDHKFVILEVFLGLAGLSVWGYWARRRLSALAMLAVGAIFFIIAAASVHGQDSFRFYRAVGYLTPFLLTGLVASSGIKGIPLAGLLATVGLVGWNASITARGFARIARYGLATDPSIHRLNPRAPEWQRLRALLAESHGAPVLITGFNETVRPHWIVSGIEPIPNVLGSDIQRFWKMMEPAESNPYKIPHTPYGIRGFPSSSDDFKWILPDWPRIFPDFLQRSRQAIVPSGGGFPVDWEAWKDVFEPRRVRFRNICDVVYKFEYEVRAAAGALGPLRRDERGTYRAILGPVRLEGGSIPTSVKDGILYIRVDGDCPGLGLRESGRDLAPVAFGRDGDGVKVEFRPGLFEGSVVSLSRYGRCRLRDLGALSELPSEP